MNCSKAIWVTPVFLLLAACAGGLAPSVQREISYEHDELRSAEQKLQRSQQTVRKEVASDPELFGSTSEPAVWGTKFGGAREKLQAAERTDRELEALSRRSRADSQERAERLLAEERRLRRSATDESQAVLTDAAKWTNFRRDLPSHLDKMKGDYEALRGMDLGALAATVQKTERDWPAKKDVLDGRFQALSEIPATAKTQWSNTEATREDASSGKASGPELATLIQASDALAGETGAVGTKSEELRSLCGQLYNSWDKILVDLDVAQYGPDRQYRERVKTVTTHLVDVASKETETASSEKWAEVPEGSYRAIENDLGMTLAHKDAGLFDSEAENTPQPAGFAYIAPESQGSNQYGYWNHTGGETVWTWLPQYLVLRELLWNHNYRPVVLDEYRGYRTAERGGQTYYGRETPASAPRYGTHGTFTRQSYAESRYVQAGGFKGSAYTAHNAGRAASGMRAPEADRRSAPAQSEKGAGRRFGSPSGRRFGQAGGLRGMGRGFGRRR